MHHSLRLLRFVALAGACGCAPMPMPLAQRAPVRVVAGAAIPETRADKALVVFAFSRCEPRAREDLFASASELTERSLMCRRNDANRIRVVEHGARFVADVGVEEYAVAFEEPGLHRYGAKHWADRCALASPSADCVGVLDANLQAGKTYFVTFRWTHIAGRTRRPNGRLEIVPVVAEREAHFRAFVESLRSVEPAVAPGEAMPGPRNEAVGSIVGDRLEQDRRDGIVTPCLP